LKSSRSPAAEVCEFVENCIEGDPFKPLLIDPLLLIDDFVELDLGTPVLLLLLAGVTGSSDGLARGIAEPAIMLSLLEFR
jgi:hypothetical protein